MDEIMGMDQELIEAPESDENIIAMPTKKEPKRAPFSLWSVNGKDYKLKLTAKMICLLERKYKRNLLMIIADDGLPPLEIMLSIIQAALDFYHHGWNFYKVQELFDTYCDEGGSQSKLMNEVIMPLMAVSGFFTESQKELLQEETKESVL